MILDRTLTFSQKDNDIIRNNNFVKTLENVENLRSSIVYDNDRNEIPQWMRQEIANL